MFKTGVFLVYFLVFYNMINVILLKYQIEIMRTFLDEV